MLTAKNSRILLIPDTHFPYQHPNFYIDLARIMRYVRPTHKVHLGDLADFHAISRHDPDPDADDISVELRKARKAISKFIDIIGPDLLVCIGNHDNRIDKRASNNGIPKVFLKSFSDVLGLPKGWRFAFDHFIGDWAFTHGKSNLRGKTALSYGCNVAQGHYHSMLDISYHQTPTRMLCSVFGGSAADEESIAMAYGRNSLAKGAYGFTVIENGIPHIIPGTKA